MSDICKKFGSRVKALRKENNLTQQEFANLSGLHKNYIGMIERGERNPTLKNIEIIGNAFELKIDELLKDINQ